MSAHEDGGPAFPSAPYKDWVQEGPGGYGVFVAGNPGMSIRDYLACQAGANLLPHGLKSNGVNDETFRRVSLDAYKFADAMLEARAK